MACSHSSRPTGPPSSGRLPSPLPTRWMCRSFAPGSSSPPWVSRLPCCWRLRRRAERSRGLCGLGSRPEFSEHRSGGAAIIRNMMSDSQNPSSPTEASATAGTPKSPKIREKGRLMSASEIERTLVRLAHEIVERNNGAANLGLVGIKRRGVPLAQRIARMIETIEKEPVETGVLDISFYRDDLSTRDVRPVVEPGELGFDVNGRDVILMDDVLYTGRTIRAALDALFDHGRPKSVQLLVLIDRG